MLGRHIRQRANQLPFAGEGHGHGVLVGRHGPPVFGETEIEQLRSGAREHDVAGLEVAMDDALLVRRGERACHLDGDLERLVERERVPDSGRESLALDVVTMR